MIPDKVAQRSRTESAFAKSTFLGKQRNQRLLISSFLTINKIFIYSSCQIENVITRKLVSSYSLESMNICLSFILIQHHRLTTKKIQLKETLLPVYNSVHILFVEDSVRDKIMATN